MALGKKDHEQLAELLRVRLTPYIRRVPHPAQHAFLWLDHVLEVFYGGAVGGGKSEALLMAALVYVDIPRYHAILFRRTFTDLSLPGSLIPLSHEYLADTDAQFNVNDSRWTFPSGATLSFGYLKNDEDRMRYRSANFSFIGFDELTTFSHLQYTYMFTRLRHPKGGPRDPLNDVPLRMRGASNPGDRGHEWVKQRFLKPVGQRADEPPDPQQRIFIPARLRDNPSIDADTYMEALAQVDEATRQQYVEGDWNAREPGEWVIPDQTWIDAAVALGQDYAESTAGPPRDWRRPFAFGIDWGEFTQAYILHPLPNGGVYILPSEVIGEHEDAATVSLRMLMMAELRGVDIPVARYDAAGVQSMRIFLKTARVRPGWERIKSQKIAFGKYKRETMNYMRLLFRRTALGKQERVIAIHPDNLTLISQLKGWKRKAPETEDIEKGIPDHGPDACIAGIAPTAAAHRAYIQAMIEKAKNKNKGKR